MLSYVKKNRSKNIKRYYFKYIFDRSGLGYPISKPTNHDMHIQDFTILIQIQPRISKFWSGSDIISDFGYNSTSNVHKIKDFKKKLKTLTKRRYILFIYCQHQQYALYGCECKN